MSSFFFFFNLISKDDNDDDDDDGNFLAQCVERDEKDIINSDEREREYFINSLGLSEKQPR